MKSVTGSEVTRYVYGGGEHLLQVIYPNQYLASDDRLDLATATPVDTYANANVGDRYTYTTDGKVLTYTNQYGLITTNHYDEGGTLTAVTKSDGTEFQFQSDGKATKEVYGNGLTNQITNDKLQTTVSGSNGMTTTWKQDAFGKVMEYQVQNGDVTKRYAYTYDDEGNILTISLNGNLQQTFTYDQFSELSRVDDAVANQSTTYTYDASGNITGIQTYAYTTGVLSTPISTLNYTYDAKNMRTDLSYDANGNLTSLNGADFTWSIRNLTGVTKGADHYSYTYNHAGIRTSKNVNGITTTYKVNEKNQVVEQSDGTNSIKFAYDSQGQPVYMEYQGKTYYYEKNLQGDIIGLFDDGKNSVVQYQYDSWGKLLNTTGTLASTVGTINPLRYRGYYYDVETGFYYLQSRYYDPESCRFLNADEPSMLMLLQGELLGSNFFAYCNNNPLILSDPMGYAPFYKHIAHALAAISSIFGLMVAVGKAVPYMQKAIFTSISAIIKLTGATGQFATFIAAVGTMVVLILSIKAIYDTARVFMGTLKYAIQELKYGLNPWHKHKLSDLSGPDFKSPFKW